ncbi:hypothetical protein MXB_874 [Myxobolus squamalis]|nr:hypothetical protein MXB_874 [Myxobolus squamalis]
MDAHSALLKILRQMEQNNDCETSRQSPFPSKEIEAIKEIRAIIDTKTDSEIDEILKIIKNNTGH